MNAVDKDCRLADKALDILHHLSRRGSVWPEASATAVRELRDRITRRPSRPSQASHSSLAPGEIDVRTNRTLGQGASMPRQYTSSSGLDTQASEAPAEHIHTTSSTGLPQDHASSHSMQTGTGESNAPSNSMSQAANANPLAENAQTFNSGPSVPYQNINTPVFDFGSSEWSDFIQASETFDSSASLPQADSMDPYIGFDIPFWLGQDQYWDMVHDRS